MALHPCLGRAPLFTTPTTQQPQRTTLNTTRHTHSTQHQLHHINSTQHDTTLNATHHHNIAQRNACTWLMLLPACLNIGSKSLRIAKVTCIRTGGCGVQHRYACVDDVASIGTLFVCGRLCGEHQYTMWWMLWRTPPVHDYDIVVDDAASTGIIYGERRGEHQ